MLFSGKVAGITRDFFKKKIMVTFETSEDITGQYDEIRDKELTIEAKKYRKRRSLDANAYFHVLVGKLADVLRISKPRCKNIMLGRYGQAFLLDDGSQAIIKSNVPVSQMLEHETFHCVPCGSKTENGLELVFYKMLRGSSTYDTAEMSILIDGVIEECKEMGIETMTPDAIRRMKAAWKNHC